MRASCRNGAAVVTGSSADYHSSMPGDAATSFRLVDGAGPAQRAVLRADAPGCSEILVLGGYQGPALPAEIRSPKVEPRTGGGFRIISEQGVLDFDARAVDQIEMRPALFDALHRPFALGAGDRLAIRVLLALLRLPGGAKLLRLWHARRSG
jgi:hypothetical protein